MGQHKTISSKQRPYEHSETLSDLADRVRQAMRSDGMQNEASDAIRQGNNATKENEVEPNKTQQPARCAPDQIR